MPCPAVSTERCAGGEFPVERVNPSVRLGPELAVVHAVVGVEEQPVAEAVAQQVPGLVGQVPLVEVQLTKTPAGSMHYHPNPSPDGRWLLYGSKRDGVRHLYVMRLGDRKERRITDLKKGRAAMWA